MTVYEYDIFTPIPHSPSRRRHPHPHSHSLHSSTRRHSLSSSTTDSLVPFPVPGPGPTYIRPEQRQNHLGISFDMSPSIAEIMSTPPPLSPSSSSMTYSSSSPTTPNSPSKLIFFPQPLSFDHEDEEEDVFAATPSSYRNQSLAKRNIIDDFSSLALGLGGIDKLPDEPFYPSISSTPSGVISLPIIPLNSAQCPSSGGGGGSGANGNQLLPSAIPYSNFDVSQPVETQKKKRKPFGHSFLPPLPPQQKGIPTPLLPMGFLPPPSSWRPPSNGSPTKSPLRRTDSDVLLPSEADIQAEETKRPIKLNGHMRKSSNDSEMTIKLGNGFVALGESSPQDTDGGSNGDFRSEPQEPMNRYGYGTERRSKPNITRTVSQRIPTNIRHESYSGGSGSGDRYRSSSTSEIIPESPPRPSSPTPYSYKPHVSSPLNQNGRPTSPIPFAMDEDYFQSQGQATSWSRFTRPISPSLPEDLLTPHAHNTYVHQTLSSAPKRPKSPTTARDSLNAVLTRHPKYEDEDDDAEGYEEDSLDRMIRNAQRFESGSSSYFPNTPPKSPSAHPYTLPIPCSSSRTGIKSKANAKRGFPILKSLFPPSPPPSSPSMNGTASPEVEDNDRPNENGYGQGQRSFDVNKVNERLKNQRGRICFEELEGVGRPFFDHEDEAEGDEHQQGMNRDTPKNGKRDGSRPGTGRRWTLPF